MKKLIASVFGVAMMAAPLVGATAAHADTTGPNQHSCFGQGRSAYATSNPPGSVGAAASARAGNNAAINENYKDSCQA